MAVQVETYRPFTIRGEVANPGQYPYVNNMTTETAIAIAGGTEAAAPTRRNVTRQAASSEQDARAASSLPTARCSPATPSS